MVATVKTFVVRIVILSDDKLFVVVKVLDVAKSEGFYNRKRGVFVIKRLKLLESLDKKVVNLLLLKVVFGEVLGFFYNFLGLVIIFLGPLDLGDQVRKVSFDRDIVDVWL